MTYRISIQLSEKEFEALRDVSQVQLRHPRDQARLILRHVLLGEHDNTSVLTNNKTAPTVAGAGGLVATR